MKMCIRDSAKIKPQAVRCFDIAFSVLFPDLHVFIAAAAQRRPDLGLIGHARGGSTDPVSYTHLDVYKRQASVRRKATLSFVNTQPKA